MRKWMRERMKRRKKPSENISESTGKVGQAKDPTKPAPLVPSYGPIADDDAHDEPDDVGPMDIDDDEPEIEAAETAPASVGDNGGKVVFEGVPEDLIKQEQSHTGEYLKERFLPPGVQREKHFDWIL